MIKAVRNPDVYHGNNKITNFFEGWYYKLVQPGTGHTYCFIPGVFISTNKEHSHSFIQVLKGQEGNFKYLRFNHDDFSASKSEFNFKIGKSSFSLSELNLNINDQNEKIIGTLNFHHIIKWPDSLINPGSMGFYNYLSFMQCYSQVCAIDGDITGKLIINGETIDFTGGKVYIEKNWGEAFPYSYIWVQGNSFYEGNGAVTCSIGRVPLPFPFKSFTGFLIGLYIEGRFYKFTTINRSVLSINCESERLVLETHNNKHLIKIVAAYKKETFMNLNAPRDDNMIPIASETLQGNLNITLYDRKKRSIIFNDCTLGGIEFSGDYINLCNKIKRT